MAFALKPIETPFYEDETGVLRFIRSRVTIDLVIYDYQNGLNADEIALHYPSLNLADIYSVLSYYLSYQKELDDYLTKQEQNSLLKQQEVLKRSSQAHLRERLRARLS